MDLVPVIIKNIVSSHKQGGSVFIGNEEKTFAIYIGPDELNALVLAGEGITPPRPLTHNLIENMIIGFDIEIDRCIISDLQNETFFATLILERKAEDDSTHQVRIDCRPSDAMVLTTLRGRPLFVEPHVYEMVEDQGPILEKLQQQLLENMDTPPMDVEDTFDPPGEFEPPEDFNPSPDDEIK